MASSEIERLQGWYQTQCNGDWAHAYGIKIGTLDNPGWSLEIDLAGTSLERREMSAHREAYDHETDWYTCKKEETKLMATGGPMQLGKMITFFLAWAGH